jgi:hypothetical protein
MRAGKGVTGLLPTTTIDTHRGFWTGWHFCFFLFSSLNGLHWGNDFTAGTTEEILRQDKNHMRFHQIPGDIVIGGGLGE